MVSQSENGERQKLDVKGKARNRGRSFQNLFLLLNSIFILFHNEQFATKICFFQNSWTAYWLLSCSLKTPRQNGNEETMTTILEQLDSGFGTRSYRGSWLNNNLSCARVTPVTHCESDLCMESPHCLKLVKGLYRIST